MDPGDEEIARRIRRGDTRAFDAFYDRYAGPLHGYLAGMTGDPAGAEDLVQEAMLRVFRHIERYEERGTFRAWVFRIATNLALTELRRRRYAATIPLDAGAPEPSDPADTDPGAAWEAEDRTNAVEATLATLPDEQRAVVLLRVRREMGIADIARTLGVPEGTVKSRLHHAIRKLREGVERMERGQSNEERRDELR